MLQQLRRLSILLFSVCALSACEVEEENVNIRLTLAERDALDDRILAHMDSLRPVLETACEESRLARVLAATDSIVQQRLEDEARMRARLPQNLQR